MWTARTLWDVTDLFELPGFHFKNKYEQLQRISEALGHPGQTIPKTLILHLNMALAKDAVVPDGPELWTKFRLQSCFRSRG